MAEEGNPTRNGASAPTEAELAFRAILRSFGQIHRAMGPYFAARGISGSQWAVLTVLGRAEGNGEKSLKLSELSERLLIRPPSVTGVVDRLVRDGLVGRASQADDLRVKRVSLTPRGRRLVASIRRGHPAKIASVMSGLGAPELRALRALHEKLAAHLEKTDSGQSCDGSNRTARTPRRVSRT